MDKSERRKLKERQKRLKQKRKEYLREEKASLRKQKLELKQHSRKKRRKSDHQSFFQKFIHLFSISPIARDHSHPRKAGPWKRFLLWRKEYASLRKNRREANRKLKHQAKQRSKMLIKEKHSTRNERSHMRKKTLPMRRKIRQARVKHFKELALAFFRQPIKIRKLKEEEKILRRHIREDVKRQRIQSIQNIPGSISSSFFFRLKMQRDKARFFFMYLNESLAGRRILGENPQLRREFFKVFFNSCILFVLAFIIAYFSNRLVTVYVAKFFDIPAVIYSYRIFWPLYTYSSLYSRQALIIIFAAGPFFSLLAGIIFYRVFVLLRMYNVNFKLLSLWIFFHSVNLFFGAYIAGVITRTDFVYATEWLFYSRVFDVEEIIFLIISVVTLLVFGFYFTRKFILAAGSVELIDPKIRLFYMLAQVFLPWLIGILIIFFINYPKNPPELLLLYSTTLLMIMPMMTNFNSISNRAVKLFPFKKNAKMGWIYLFFALALLLLIRFYIFNGVSFK